MCPIFQFFKFLNIKILKIIPQINNKKARATLLELKHIKKMSNGLKKYAVCTL